MTTPAELRAQLDVKGAEISLLAEQIEARFYEMKDWRYNIEKAPIRTVTTALGAGLVLAGIGLPLLRTVSREVGVVAKASLTAYLTALFTNKLQQLAER